MTVDRFPTLEKFRDCLREDLDNLVRSFVGAGEKSPNQPIGLKASIAPYNCSQETMLAYLMSVFKLNQSQLDKILHERQSKASPASKRKGSWRPEIRFKLGHPVQSHNEQESLKNLLVRVYMFRDQQAQDDKRELSAMSRDGRGLLNVVAADLSQRRAEQDRAVMIRPKNQVLRELRFNNNRVSKSSSSGSDKAPKGACKGRLSVRRDYTESQNAHILRFEFWLKKTEEAGPIQKVSRYLAQSNFCCPTKRRRDDSVEDSVEWNFYGFINLRLDQVPAYPIKTIYPILSLKGERVNSCEVGVEFLNRDAAGGMDLDDPVAETSDSKKLEKEKRIIYHQRLYVNCLIYQMLTIRKQIMANEAKDLDQIISNMTLDNLFYLPAHTLVNQHRLQSNLRQLEDQSLRRSAMLLLLADLSEVEANRAAETTWQAYQLLLVAIIQHEYLTAHRPFDDKTMQQVEIFNGDQLERDESSEVVIDIEVAAIASFFDKIISAQRLTNGWLGILPAQRKFRLDRVLTLASLRLAGIIIAHAETNYLVRSKLKLAASLLMEQVDSILTKVVTEFLKKTLASLLAADRDSAQQQPLRVKRNFKVRRRGGATSSSSAAAKHSADEISWLRLSRDLQQIDHDLALNWSPKGLDGLGIGGADLLEFSDGNNKRARLNQLIERKMTRYLQEKS